MSFGTGHQQDYNMMIQHLLETEVTGSRNTRYGRGTFILAILAEMKGTPNNLDAIDIVN
jgi:ribosomal protein L11 methyltransferase